ncbi:unnamed protein product [Anisakis simplex]|uniref:Chitinase domain-containing protein 1 n=1 Tax=Anisakis simplex TaxID=6269 RepID=A0A0M3JWZ4_ANISI|nr:unnamed protein product [Anisakis simplex]
MRCEVEWFFVFAALSALVFVGGAQQGGSNVPGSQQGGSNVPGPQQGGSNAGKPLPDATSSNGNSARTSNSQVARSTSTTGPTDATTATPTSSASTNQIISSISSGNSPTPKASSPLTAMPGSKTTANNTPGNLPIPTSLPPKATPGKKTTADNTSGNLPIPKASLPPKATPGKKTPANNTSGNIATPKATTPARAMPSSRKINDAHSSSPSSSTTVMSTALSSQTFNATYSNTSASLAETISKATPTPDNETVNDTNSSSLLVPEAMIPSSPILSSQAESTSPHSATSKDQPSDGSAKSGHQKTGGGCVYEPWNCRVPYKGAGPALRWTIVVLACILALLIMIACLMVISDRKRHKPVTEETIPLKLEVDPDDVTLSSILANHKNLNTGAKVFDRATLGYVTPWNSHGYDIAKWAANKFTHISPVWFQLKPAVIDGRKTCSVGGTHDIDQGWIRDVRSNNSEIAIVPRFLIEQWTSKEAAAFLYDELWQRRCVQVMTDLIERNEMQGAVVEMWLQLLSLTGAKMTEVMIELIQSWCEFFHAKDLEFIMPLSPPLNAKYELTGIISTEHFAEMAKHVDFINVMAYDYHTDRPAGVAPIEWIRRNMEFLLKESPVSASKVLLGINFYGFEFTERSVDAITSPKYLEHLKSDEASLNWDDSNAEHFVVDGHSITYYPSLASLSVRLKYAKRMNMGIAIWDIGQGLNYFTRLL